MTSLAAGGASKTDVPSDANTGCVGTQSDQAGKAASCQGCPNQAACASGAARQEDPALKDISARMSQIDHTILVLSGKGGVGKSTFSTQLAFSLAARGFTVGLLDIDICGPSVPLMLGLVGHEVRQSGSGWSPVYVTKPVSGATADAIDEDVELGVMSIGFLLPEQDSAIIWRGPRKNALIKQFLTDVDWGHLDYLVIDTPPGTSDEHISIAQYLRSSMNPRTDGAVVVTTPQEAAMADVRKELNFCKQVGMRVLGVVENMRGLRVPLSALQQGMGMITDDSGADCTQQFFQQLGAKCPELLNMHLQVDVFGSGDSESCPERMARAFNVPYLGAIPMDSRVCAAGESGVPVDSGSVASPALNRIVDQVVASVGN